MNRTPLAVGVVLGIILAAGLGLAVWLAWPVPPSAPAVAGEAVTLSTKQLDPIRAALTGPPPGRTVALRRLAGQPDVARQVRPVLDKLAGDATLTAEERRLLDDLRTAKP